MPLLPQEATAISQMEKGNIPGGLFLIHSSYCHVGVGEASVMHLNSIHSKCHKSVSVRMHYEEVNSYQIAFSEDE